MKTFVLLSVLALAASPASAATCSGPGPAITSAVVKSLGSDGKLNHYRFNVTVTNNGSSAEPSSTLQFVDIYAGSEKLDAKGVPPLQPGQSYAFSYVSNRSVEAGDGSSTLTFKLDPVNATSDCGATNGMVSVTF